MSNPIPRLGLSPAEVAESVGIGEKAVRQAIASGELISARIGTRYVVQPEEVRAWLTDLTERGARAS